METRNLEKTVPQETTFGDAEITTYLEVKKKDGTTRYYKVVDEQNVEITEQEYKENT